MAATRETTNKLYTDVRAEYLRLSQKVEFGELVYTKRYIYARLAAQFYRSKKTIEDIVFERV